jgi:hypothetical protein
MNLKLLRKVKAHILAEAERLNMKEWVTMRKFRPSVDEFDKDQPHYGSCNTAACIGGWGFLLTYGPRATRKKIADDDLDETEMRGLFGLDSEQAVQLFYVDSWPEDLQKAWEETGPKAFKARAKIVAKRIERFIQEYAQTG